MSTPYLSEHQGTEVDLAVTIVHAAGVVNVANGVAGGSVTGLDLSFTPTHGILTVISPAEGYILVPVFVKDSFSTDGFDYYLSGETPDGDYQLSYILFP
jgi:hypothetical protein